MPTQKLKKYLDEEGVKYVSISHSAAYTAQEIAASAHISGNEMAKSVVVKVDGKPALFVLRGSEHADLWRLRDALDAEDVELAREGEFPDMFPDCETGAMPPFGNLYGMEVYVDPRLAENEQIVFNAGTHTELIRMSWKDFLRLVKPKVVSQSAAS